MIASAGAAGAAVFGFVAGALLTGIVAYPLGASAGRQGVRAELVRAAVATERERTRDDAILDGMPDRDLCERALRARRMPVDACAGL